MTTKFPIVGRRKRKWISYTYPACHYDQIVLVVMRCPVKEGVVLFRLGWLHKTIPD